MGVGTIGGAEEIPAPDGRMVEMIEDPRTGEGGLTSEGDNKLIASGARCW